MSKKQKKITCSYCGAENSESTTICSKCGRIIKAREKAPFDYRPITALIVVLVIIASIVGTVVFVMNHWNEYWNAFVMKNWNEYWNAFHYWYLNNENAVLTILYTLLIVSTTIIVCKFSDAETFGSIYWISYITMFVLVLIVEGFDCWMTDEPFSDIFTILFGVLILSLPPSVFVKIIRLVSN